MTSRFQAVARRYDNALNRLHNFVLKPKYKSHYPDLNVIGAFGSSTSYNHLHEKILYKGFEILSNKLGNKLENPTISQWLEALGQEENDSTSQVSKLIDEGNRILCSLHKQLKNRWEQETRGLCNRSGKGQSKYMHENPELWVPEGDADLQCPLAICGEQQPWKWPPLRRRG